MVQKVCFVQGHPAGQCQSRDLNPGLFVLVRTVFACDSEKREVCVSHLKRGPDVGACWPWPAVHGATSTQAPYALTSLVYVASCPQTCGLMVMK